VRRKPALLQLVVGKDAYIVRGSTKEWWLCYCPSSVVLPGFNRCATNRFCWMVQPMMVMLLPAVVGAISWTLGCCKGCGGAASLWAVAGALYRCYGSTGAVNGFVLC
jgi:hypothetical protein